MGPLSAIQVGNTLQLHVDREHPDYRRFRDALEASADAIPDRIAQTKESIRQLSAGFHAFDVVFAVWSTFGVVRAGRLRPIEGDGTPAITEYVAHVLLGRGDAGPERAPTADELRAGSPDPSKLGGLVREALEASSIWFTHRQSRGQHELDPWLELRSRLYLHRLVVRSFSYRWQEEDTLRSLFEPFASELVRSLGFDVAQAVTLVDAVAKLPQVHTSARASEARRLAKELTRRVERFRKAPHESTSDQNGLLVALAALSTSERKRRIEFYAMTWMSQGLGQHAAFTAAELAEHAAVDASAAAAFIRAFSTTFENEPEEVDPERAIGWEVEAMRRRPLLHDGSGRYLPTAPESLFFALRDVLTEALKREERGWRRFSRHRGNHLEQRAVDALAQALRADWHHRSVKYWSTNDVGAEEEGEVDGILRVDDIVVLVEAKAGSLHPSARRTAPERLEKELRKLIAEAHDQLARAEERLTGSRLTRVTDEHGSPLELDLAGASRVMHVAVTLEDLSALAPAAWQFKTTGLLPETARVPWVVGIHELELVCDLVERPAQLVHYMIRRSRTYAQRIWGTDEMDFFMKYLLDGLFLRDVEVEGRTVDISNHTDELDAYMFGMRGLGPPRKRPKQRMNRDTRRMLAALDEKRFRGRIEAQIMLMELSTDSRERLGQAPRKLARLVKADGRSHDMTLAVTGDFGCSIHVVPKDLRAGLHSRLERHGSMRRELSGLSRWVGLGYVIDDLTTPAVVVVSRDPS